MSTPQPEGAPKLQNPPTAIASSNSNTGIVPALAHALACLALAALAYVPKGFSVDAMDGSGFDPQVRRLVWQLMENSPLIVLATSAAAAACFRWPKARIAFGLLAASIALMFTVLLLPGHVSVVPPVYYLYLLATVGVWNLSANPLLGKTVAIAARLSGSRKADVNGHWFSVVNGIHFSTQDFYQQLEQMIRARQLPGVEFFRLTHFETGLLSARREYLRIVRQRHIFDICAAPFGTEYFFSCRKSVLPVAVNAKLLIAFVIALLAGFGLLFSFVGWTLGFVGYFLLLFAGIGLLRNLNQAGLSRVDAVLVQLPGIGVLYEAWFRRDTYFQEDTRVVFLALVNSLVKEAVETTSAAKGLELAHYHEHEPVLAGLYHSRQKSLTAPDRANRP